MPAHYLASHAIMRSGGDYAHAETAMGFKMAYRRFSRVFLMLLFLMLAACASTTQRPSPVSSPCVGTDCGAGPGASGVRKATRSTKETG